MLYIFVLVLMSLSLAFYWLNNLMCSAVQCFDVISLSVSTFVYCNFASPSIISLFAVTIYIFFFSKLCLAYHLVYGSSFIGVAYMCIDLCNDSLWIAHSQFTQLHPASSAHTLQSISQLNDTLKVNTKHRSTCIVVPWPWCWVFHLCVCLDGWDNESCLVVTST